MSQVAEVNPSRNVEFLAREMQAGGPSVCKWLVFQQEEMKQQEKEKGVQQPQEDMKLQGEEKMQQQQQQHEMQQPQKDNKSQGEDKMQQQQQEEMHQGEVPPGKKARQEQEEQPGKEGQSGGKMKQEEKLQLELEQQEEHIQLGVLAAAGTQQAEKGISSTQQGQQRVLPAAGKQQGEKRIPSKPLEATRFSSRRKRKASEDSLQASRGESARSWSLATSLVAPASAAAIDDSSMHSSLAASDSATGIGGGKHTQEWVTQEEWRRQYDLDAGYVAAEPKPDPISYKQTEPEQAGGNIAWSAPDVYKLPSAPNRDPRHPMAPAPNRYPHSPYPPAPNRDPRFSISPEPNRDPRRAAGLDRSRAPELIPKGGPPYGPLYGRPIMAPPIPEGGPPDGPLYGRPLMAPLIPGGGPPYDSPLMCHLIPKGDPSYGRTPMGVDAFLSALIPEGDWPPLGPRPTIDNMHSLAADAWLPHGRAEISAPYDLNHSGHLHSTVNYAGTASASRLAGNPGPWSQVGEEAGLAVYPKSRAGPPAMKKGGSGAGGWGTLDMWEGSSPPSTSESEGERGEPLAGPRSQGGGLRAVSREPAGPEGGERCVEDVHQGANGDEGVAPRGRGRPKGSAGKKRAASSMSGKAQQTAGSEGVAASAQGKQAFQVDSGRASGAGKWEKLSPGNTGVAPSGTGRPQAAGGKLSLSKNGIGRSAGKEGAVPSATDKLHRTAGAEGAAKKGRGRPPGVSGNKGAAPSTSVKAHGTAGDEGAGTSEQGKMAIGDKWQLGANGNWGLARDATGKPLGAAGTLGVGPGTSGNGAAANLGTGAGASGNGASTAKQLALSAASGMLGAGAGTGGNGAHTAQQLALSAPGAAREKGKEQPWSVPEGDGAGSGLAQHSTSQHLTGNGSTAPPHNTSQHHTIHSSTAPPQNTSQHLTGHGPWTFLSNRKLEVYETLMALHKVKGTVQDPRLRVWPGKENTWTSPSDFPDFVVRGRARTHAGSQTNTRTFLGSHMKGPHANGRVMLCGPMACGMPEEVAPGEYLISVTGARCYSGDPTCTEHYSQDCHVFRAKRCKGHVVSKVRAEFLIFRKIPEDEMAKLDLRAGPDQVQLSPGSAAAGERLPPGWRRFVSKAGVCYLDENEGGVMWHETKPEVYPLGSNPDAMGTEASKAAHAEIEASAPVAPPEHEDTVMLPTENRRMNVLASVGFEMTPKQPDLPAVPVRNPAPQPKTPLEASPKDAKDVKDDGPWALNMSRKAEAYSPRTPQRPPPKKGKTRKTQDDPWALNMSRKAEAYRLLKSMNGSGADKPSLLSKWPASQGASWVSSSFGTSRTFLGTHMKGTGSNGRMIMCGPMSCGIPEEIAPGELFISIAGSSDPHVFRSKRCKGHYVSKVRAEFLLYREIPADVLEAAKHAPASSKPSPRAKRPSRYKEDQGADELDIASWLTSLKHSVERSPRGAAQTSLKSSDGPRGSSAPGVGTPEHYDEDDSDVFPSKRCKGHKVSKGMKSSAGPRGSSAPGVGTPEHYDDDPDALPRRKGHKASKGLKSSAGPRGSSAPGVGTPTKAGQRPSSSVDSENTEDLPTTQGEVSQVVVDPPPLQPLPPGWKRIVTKAGIGFYDEICGGVIWHETKPEVYPPLALATVAAATYGLASQTAQWPLGGPATQQARGPLERRAGEVARRADDVSGGGPQLANSSWEGGQLRLQEGRQTWARPPQIGGSGKSAEVGVGASPLAQGPSDEGKSVELAGGAGQLAQGPLSQGRSADVGGGASPQARGPLDPCKSEELAGGAPKPAQSPLSRGNPVEVTGGPSPQAQGPPDRCKSVDVAGGASEQARGPKGPLGEGKSVEITGGPSRQTEGALGGQTSQVEGGATQPAHSPLSRGNPVEVAGEASPQAQGPSDPCKSEELAGGAGQQAQSPMSQGKSAEVTGGALGGQTSQVAGGAPQPAQSPVGLGKPVEVTGGASPQTEGALNEGKSVEVAGGGPQPAQTPWGHGQSVQVPLKSGPSVGCPVLPQAVPVVRAPLTYPPDGVAVISGLPPLTGLLHGLPVASRMGAGGRLAAAPRGPINKAPK
eukprot:gene3058-13078_t